jgi:hypothetical protein
MFIEKETSPPFDILPLDQLVTTSFVFSVCQRELVCDCKGKMK